MGHTPGQPAQGRATAAHTQFYYPSDPTTFSEGTWTLQTCLQSPSEKVLGSLGLHAQLLPTVEAQERIGEVYSSFAERPGWGSGWSVLQPTHQQRLSDLVGPVTCITYRIRIV